MSFYKIFPLRLTDKDAFLEASREELRVLLALIEREGDSDALEKVCGVSKARVRSALMLWQEAGVIEPADEKAGTITYEFEERLRSSEILDEGSLKAAKDIRDNKLHALFAELESIMSRTINSQESKLISSLYTQYKLDEEYIATLASYLAEKKKLTPKRLVDTALKLCESEIDTIERLTSYITDKESESEVVYAFKSIFGAGTRPITSKEKAYFEKWSREYGYFTNIVKEAYDITVNATGKINMPYTDKILEGWYKAGCRTLAECRAKYDEESEKRRAQKSAAKTARKAKEQKDRYGDFDITDAFNKALERSYGEDKK